MDRGAFVIRVLVVHEHCLIGDSIAAALQDKPGISIAGCAADIDTTVDFLEYGLCDVVVASITLPNNAALEIARLVAENGYPVKVLVTELICSKAATLHCIEEGAAGYLYVDESLESLAEKIWALQKGEFPLPPSIAGGLITRVNELRRLADTETAHQRANRRRQGEELTPREREVLNLMVLGSSNQDIADALVIEVGTVKNHIHSIFRKLDIQCREQALFFAQQFA
jgi:DNA-binding NarL/FixJ family response regulator